MPALPRLVFAALVAITFSCAAIRPDPPRELQAYAGTPVSFETAESGRGAEYDWMFGDGQTPIRGPRATYSFARSGRYEVRALRGGQLAATFHVSVVPRPVLHAIPRDARAALYLSRTKDLRTALEFARRAVGPLVSDDLFDREPLLRIALSAEEGAAAELGLDEDEGLGVFRLGTGEWIGTVGTADDAKALAAARQRLEESGFRAAASAEGVLVMERGGVGLVGVVDRGYLYLATVDTPESAGGRVAGMRERLRAIPDDGLAGDSLLKELRGQIAEGQATVFWRDDMAGANEGVRGGAASLRFQGDEMDLDGRLRGDGPLWDASRSPQRPPLERGPEGPVLALSASVSPDDLARMIRGARASAGELDGLARLIEGDVAVAAYFDARATARAMRGGLPKPSSVGGTLIAHAGIRDRRGAERFLESSLERSALPFKKRSAADATTFLVEWGGHRAAIEVTDRRMSLEAGLPLRDRRGVALAESLRSRFVPLAFGPGHVSLLVDVGQVTREMDPGVSGRGVEAAAMLGMLSVFIRQATAVETIFLDLEPDPRGGRLRGRVTLR
ncbi:MAG TPA: PKD domain-containing protein, partial [Myxococcaceae bacterium]|nr:PKD domain-containing protein [Myxococcaceae bacterium]